MAPSLSSVKKLISQIQTFMSRVEKKDRSLSTREAEQSPYGMIFQLRENTVAFLAHAEALDLLLETATKIETYRGKGTQILNDGIPEILQFILAELHDDLSHEESFPPKYPDENKQIALQKIALFALLRAHGDGKKLRSRRAAELRENYWNILAEIAEVAPFPEALTLAKTTAQAETLSLPERSGAIAYLLTDLASRNEQEAPDPEIESIINNLRDNPPSRDILFQILDHGVNSGQTDEMSALFELEDFDEENNSH